MAGDRQFHIADYVVFSLTMIISIAIGIYHARKRRSASTNDYMVGSRSMRSFPLALSMVVSFESAILVLGFPAEIYTHGIIFFWIIISVPLSHLIVYRIVPRVIYPLKITTIYEYFDLCFKSKAVRTLASILALVHQVIYMGVVLFGPAIALQAVVGFPFEWSIIVLASVSILYTSTGGFRAVIWTDVFQSGIMILGAIVVLIKGTIDAGGPAEIYEHNLKGERLTLFNFDFNPSVRHTTWCLLFGGLVKGLSFGLNQASIQRISSASDQRTSERALLMCIPLYFITTLIPIAHGLIIYGYYSKIRCDPLANEEIENSNQIIALFVIDVFKSLPGLAGLFIAALFSACLR
ncbi:hypothetical protein LOTGIDRAFT_142921 [Lottia gigantea]|uniref:Sodium-dependent multivitamin transporter n=1 Tax=Lottia gigantea TaxID=225164 RepID=V4AY06_LOTGI|nr:hypothetical protein LOTGIDRAFT_142921 [Lottia gigantea]ESO98486.1 hypothetical protein LOTGIDRAFT_142921 [Lottia gigantea]